MKSLIVIFLLGLTASCNLFDSPEPRGAGIDADADVDVDAADVSTISDARSSHCTDRIQNADETSLDCGGATCSGCEIGLRCRQDSDCASYFCVADVCSSPCNDGMLNGDESDVDCGGGCATCGLTRRCNTDEDCTSTSCRNAVCVDVAPCTNGLQDAGETDIDCGGDVCPLCPSGQACLVDSDCVGGLCDEGLCSLTGWLSTAHPSRIKIDYESVSGEAFDHFIVPVDFDALGVSIEGAAIFENGVRSSFEREGSVAWVRIERFFGTKTLEVYFGDSNLAVLDTSSTTWFGGFIGVWHLSNGEESADTHSGMTFSTQFTEGKFSDAAAFTSLPSTRVVVPPTPEFNYIGDFTISAWINGTYNPNGFNTIISKAFEDTPVDNDVIFAVYKGALTLVVRIGALEYVTAATPMPAGWRFVAATVTGGVVRLFVDGVRVSNVTLVGQADLTSMTEVTIGTDTQDLGRTYISDNFVGMVDEVRWKGVTSSDSYIEERFAIESGSSVTVNLIETF